MYRLAIVLSFTLLTGGAAVSTAGAGEPASPIEKLVKAYCDRHGLARDLVEPWKSALAPDGRVFRHKLVAVPANDKRAAMPERHAFVFVDPDAGNVYTVKRMPGGDNTLTQRTLAILRLMGTKVGDSKQATAVMADFGGSTMAWTAWRSGADARVRFVQAIQGKNWLEPPTTYIGDSGSPTPHVVMPVDQDGYVTDFRMWNIR